jgi:hypothetical protein
MRLADFSSDFHAAPIDPFKVEHSPKKYKFDVAPHVHKITHWKREDNEFIEEQDPSKAHKKVHTWSELEKMFRCEGGDRLINKIIKQSENRECAIEESLEKAEKLNALGFASPKKRLNIVRGKESQMKDHPTSNGKTAEKIRVERNSVLRNSIQGPTPDGGNAGNFTSRQNNQMTSSAPSAGFQLMGKTSLFSRVALSPNATVGGGKKADLGSSIPAAKGKDLNGSINDGDTMASTINNQPNSKTFRSTTNTFKDAV